MLLEGMSKCCISLLYKYKDRLVDMKFNKAGRFSYCLSRLFQPNPYTYFSLNAK